MEILLYNFDRSKAYAPIRKFKNLTFDTDLNLGFSLANWEDSRKSLKSYKDLIPFVQVDIMDKGEVAWSGFLDEPGHVGYNYGVQAKGWVDLLNRTGTTANQDSKTCTSFLQNVVLADSSITPFLSAGVMSGGDYTCPAIEVFPWKYYGEIMGEYLKWDNHRLSVWGNRRLNWGPAQTAVKWVIRASECLNTFEMLQMPSNYWNAVPYSFDDGGGVDTGLVTNLASKNEWGRWVYEYLEIPGIVTAGQASYLANRYLAIGSQMTFAGDIVTKKIYTWPNYSPAPIESPWRIKAGDPVLIGEFLTADALISGEVDEITSFEVKSTSYTAKEKTIEIVPKDRLETFNTMLARLEAGMKLR